MATRQFKLMLRLALISHMVVASCGKRVIKEEVDSPVADINISSPGHGWFQFKDQLASGENVNRLRSVGGFDHDSALLIAGFGIDGAKKMDVGVYGKIGANPVFVARKSRIPDFDRLYWVMVRVLSEKYGCFIKGKSAATTTVKFHCRDRRTVIMERSIDSEFAKFSGRQFDPRGREIIIRPKAVVRAAK
jgi:hypothetical protein